MSIGESLASKSIPGNESLTKRISNYPVRLSDDAILHLVIDHYLYQQEYKEDRIKNYVLYFTILRLVIESLYIRGDNRIGSQVGRSG